MKDPLADIKVVNKMRKNSSMLNWFPLVQGCGVPMPETYFIKLSEREARSGEDFLASIVNKKIYDKILRLQKQYSLGYPFFMRTDQTSGKHSFSKTCCVVSKENIHANLCKLVWFSRNADILGLPLGAIVARRFIPLAALFTAFMEMPIAPERRFFVRDGEVECRHPYWPEDSIKRPSVENWQELLRKMNTLGDEIPILDEYARTLGAKLPGYWSLDFALGKDGMWHFIDAALGDISFHDPLCSFSNQK